MNESAYCYGRLWMCVCDVCGSRPEFLNEDIRVWPKICSIHPVIRRSKPDKKNSTSFISISGSNCEGVWKNLKMSYPMIDNSAVWKARAVRLPLLDRACRAAHWATIGFLPTDFSQLLHRLKSPTQWSSVWLWVLYCVIIFCRSTSARVMRCAVYCSASYIKTVLCKAWQQSTAILADL
jgi:hypothetical protein